MVADVATVGSFSWIAAARVDVGVIGATVGGMGVSVMTGPAGPVKGGVDVALMSRVGFCVAETAMEVGGKGVLEGRDVAVAGMGVLDGSIVAVGIGVLDGRVVALGGIVVMLTVLVDNTGEGTVRVSVGELITGTPDVALG